MERLDGCDEAFGMFFTESEQVIVFGDESAAQFLTPRADGGSKPKLSGSRLVEIVQRVLRTEKNAVAVAAQTASQLAKAHKSAPIVKGFVYQTEGSSCALTGQWQICTGAVARGYFCASLLP